MNKLDEIGSSPRRAFRIVEHVARGGETSNLSELSRNTGITRVTAMRLLSDLEGVDILERLPGGGHRVGLAMLRIASLALSDEDLYRLGQRVIGRLSARLQLTAYLVVPDGANILFLRKHLPPTPLVSNISIGSVLPAHLTAPGRAMLSHLTVEKVHDLLGPEPLARATEKSPTTYAALEKLLAADREAGCSWSYSGYERGIDACSAAVIDPSSNAVAAISVVGPSDRFTDSDFREYAQSEIITATNELSTLIRGLQPHSSMSVGADRAAAPYNALGEF